jgi:5'-deoxynucleotidase YfbR-like HD superfamily hydrolase
LTQEQVDKIIADRLARAERKHGQEMAALQAELKEYKQAEEARRVAEMTEVEKAQKAVADARAEAEAARAAAHMAEVKALRAEMTPADLPSAYRLMITGDTPDDIAESVKLAQEAFRADRERAERSAQEMLLQDIGALTPEQLAEKYKDLVAVSSVVARLTGKPVSIGAPSAAGGQAAPPVKPGEITGGMGLAAYRMAVSRPPS